MARAYTVGDQLPFAANIYDSSGNLADGSSVTLTLIAPDGTTTTPSVTHVSTGVYTCTATASMAGRYLGQWSSSGANAGGEPQAFWVLPATPIVTVAEFKRHLGVVLTEDDDELSIFIAAAIPIVESVAGPLTSQTITETFDGGRHEVRLRYLPTAVTSVTEFGRTLTANTEYIVNTDYGFVRRGTTYFNLAFFDGSQNITVTYTTGPTVVAANAQMAVKEMAKYLWRQVKTDPNTFQDGFLPQASVSGVSEAMMKRIRLLLGKSTIGPSVV